MTGRLLRRAAYAALVLVGVNLLTFVLFFAVNTPDDMARLNIGGKHVNAEQIRDWRAARGYDKPLFVNVKEPGHRRYTETIFWQRSVSLLALDFGRSDAQGTSDIRREVVARMGVSVQLALPILLLQIVAGVGFALILVLFRDTPFDAIGVAACVGMLSISALFYVIVGQLLFVRVLHLAPVSGYAPGLQAAHFLMLPALLAVLSRLGSDSRFYRALLQDELGRPYVLAARAKGLSDAQVLRRHVLRNALLPIVTSAGSDLPDVFLGSLIFESFFGIPGLGAYMVDAINAQDFAVVRTMVFVGALIYIAGFLLIDGVCLWLDPRLRRPAIRG